MSQLYSRTAVILFSLITLTCATWAMFYKPQPAQAAAIIVLTNAEDDKAHDVNPGDGKCEDVFGDCPLRAAIMEANALPGPDIITFDNDMHIYLKGNLLPDITGPLTIDASSVWDTTNNQPGVLIDGQGITQHGLILDGGNVTLYGLHFTDLIDNALFVTSGNNTIGGTNNNQRNIFTHSTNGIYLTGSNANSNLIQNNYFGVKPDGVTPDQNSIGILLDNAGSNIIGGSTANSRNVISGNSSHGISLQGAETKNNQIGSNLIGIGADGVTAIANGTSGINFNGAHENIVGLVDATPAEVRVANHTMYGIQLLNSSRNDIFNAIIEKNFIGVTIEGSSTLNEFQGNAIHHNTNYGAYIFGASSRQNSFLLNSFHKNTHGGIYLHNGGNDSLAAPTISTASLIGASGTSACSSCTVELFFDTDDQGLNHAGMTTTDATGNWTFSDPLLSGPNLTATVTDVQSNTSQFSVPIALPAIQSIYLPSILK